MTRHPALAFALIFGLLGCEDGMAGPDAGGADAATPDSAALDSAALDSAALDSSALDSAALDASSMDGGPVRADAGPDPDAGADFDGGSGLPRPCVEAGRPLPVVPCAAGFGMETPAGSGRHLDTPMTTVHRVTHLDASGSGSLAACIEASGPRVCVFEVSGIIELTSNLVINDPYLTIAGQTAPSPGISIHGAGIRVEADDVLISHLRVRVGDRRRGPPVHNRDAIGISNRNVNPRRVVVDHCSLAFSSDEMLSVWYSAGDVTVYESLLGLPLDDSIHVDEGDTEPAPHGFGVLFGQETDRVALVRTVLAHHNGRNPLSRSNGMVMANNIVYDWGENVTVLSSQSGSVNRATIVGNLYIPGPSSVDRPVIRVNNVTSASEIFLAENVGPNVSSDPWSIVQGPDRNRVESPPVVFDGYEFGPADELRGTLLDSVGAWPSARDAVDERIVREIREESGSVINCVEADGSRRCEANGGGWPTLEENTRALELPERPNADDDGDGYTNLEAWLFSFRP